MRDVFTEIDGGVESNKPWGSRMGWGVIGLLLLVGSLLFWRGAGEPEPAVLFLAWDENDLLQLARVTADGESVPILLTAHDQPVREFVLSPDGAQVIYTVVQENGTSQLWLMRVDGGESRLVLDCPEAACGGATWSPTPNRLIYERREMSVPSPSSAAARLWWLDLVGNVTVPVLEDETALGWGAQFSPDGAWLSFVVPYAEQVWAYHFESGETISAASRTGERPFWGPDGMFYFTDIALIGEAIAIHIYRLDPQTKNVIDLSGEELLVNDGGVIWSPTDELIGFTRKPARAPSGMQLWLMGFDGSEQRSLTQVPDVHHGVPQWSDDGVWLVYQVYNLMTPSESPVVWVMNIESGEQIRLGQGIQPVWLSR